MVPQILLAALLSGITPPADGPSTGRAARFATFNASLNRARPGQLLRDLAAPDDPQARNVAEIIQRTRPDVLLINEFDHDPEGRGPRLFQENYLSVGQNGAEPIEYPHRFASEVNTGVPSGRDLDNDGQVATVPGSRDYGNDAFGFGLFPGQYGMVVFSKYPIDRPGALQFRAFLWKDLPGPMLPTRPDGSPWYPTGVLEVVRLSSKDHWDLPIRIGDRIVHVLASHPTPPAFDGPERRNGKRNHDEIKFWAEYIAGGPFLEKLRPFGATSAPPAFVIMGDLNADPFDGGGIPGAIGQLLSHPKVESGFVPTGRGGAEASRAQGGANAGQKGPPEADTADFEDGSVGNLRVDHVLPSKGLKVLGGGVFWPEEADPLARLVRMKPAVASSDHRLVYLDIAID